MGKKKNSVALLSYALLALSVIGISIYLYRNPNIREKLSFASSIGVVKNESLSQPIRPTYKFVAFETITPPANAYISDYAKLANGEVIIAGTCSYPSAEFESFPAFWNQDGELTKYLFNKEYRGGHLVDLKSEGFFTTLYYKRNKDSSNSYYAFLQNINSNEIIELKSPEASVDPVPTSSLLRNERALKLKKELETLAPNGVGSSIFNQLYSPYLQVMPFSINSKGDVGGNVATEKDGLIDSIGVVWLASEEYVPLDLSNIISSQFGGATATEQNIYLIDDNKNIWANANVDGKIKLGYFEYVGGDKWKLKQSWDSPHSTYYTDLRAHNSEYVIIRQDNYAQYITSNNYVYSKRRTPLGGFVSKNPYVYKFRIEDVLQNVVNDDIEYVGILSLNEENELVGLFISNHNNIDFFTMNIETKSVQIFSDLIKSGAILYPEDISMFITMIDDMGNLYVQTEKNYTIEVGMLKKL